MTFEPIATASPMVQIHLAAALLALAIGAAQFTLPKGTASHKLLGRTWVGLLAVIAVGSFWITGLNGDGLSPIHGLSAFTIAMLVLGVRAAWRGNIRVHRFTMIGIYGGALIGAGLGALAPGRILWQAATGG